MVCVKHSTSSILFLAGHGSDEEVILCFFFLYSAMWVCVSHGGWRQLWHGGWNLGSNLEYLFLWKLDCSCNLYRIALFKKEWWNLFGLITESLRYLGGDSRTWNDVCSVCYQLGRQREGGRKHQREPNEAKARKERAKKWSETEGGRSMSRDGRRWTFLCAGAGVKAAADVLTCLCQTHTPDGSALTGGLGGNRPSGKGHWGSSGIPKECPGHCSWRTCLAELFWCLAT